MPTSVDTEVTEAPTRSSDWVCGHRIRRQAVGSGVQTSAQIAEASPE